MVDGKKRKFALEIAIMAVANQHKNVLLVGHGLKMPVSEIIEILTDMYDEQEVRDVENI